MTFNQNANVGGNRARRRGAGAAVAGGGIAGIGALAVILFQLFTGTDISGHVPSVPQPGGGAESEIEQCETGADANARDDCRLAAGSVVLDEYWSGEVQGYRPPGLTAGVVVSAATLVGLVAWVVADRRRRGGASRLGTGAGAS